MEWLFIIALGAVLFKLWGRVDGLERQLADSHAREMSQRAQEEASADENPPRDLTRPAPAPSADLASPAIAPAAAHAQHEDPALSEGMAAAADATDPEPADPSAPRFAFPQFALPRFDFEDIFGRRLPIWAGGIALAVGGIFLVRYAIEAGLLGPIPRVAMSFAFGIALLAAAETAHRFEQRLADPRVRQALAGAGLATLYAAFYLAGAQYGLIGPGIAFAGLAAVTALAIGLTFRFGLPAAVLGLIGGFATPVLVASEEANVPILAFYLALLVAGLALTARRLGHAWLGAGALAGGFAWGILMLLGQPSGADDLVSVGIYLLVLGAAVPVVLGDGARLPYTRIASGAIAAVQLAALVSLAGFDLLTWGLYLLLAAALAALSWWTRELRSANLLVGAVGIALLAAWPAPATLDFALVAGALALVVLGNALALQRQGEDVPLVLAQLALGALGIGLAAHWQFGSVDNKLAIPGLAAGHAALAVAAALGAWMAWRARMADTLLALPVSACAILGFAALHVVLPDWAEVLGASVVALALAELLRRRSANQVLASLAWSGAALVLITLASTGPMLEELSHMFGAKYEGPSLPQSLARWGAAALPLLALAILEWRKRARRLAEALLGLVTYGLLAQLVTPLISGDWLAWTAAAAALIALWRKPGATGFWGAMLGVGLLWALPPAIVWSAAAISALAGKPMLLTGLPDWASTLRQILPLALVAGAGSWVRAGHGASRRALAGVAALAALIAVHTTFKQIFGLGDGAAFAQLGMAERTIWQALLIGAGIAIGRFVSHSAAKPLACGLAIAGLAHFVIFTLALHNPLWADQAVGPMPFVNWLLAAYTLAGLCASWLAGQVRGANGDKVRLIGDALLMLLISFWALSQLRQFFAGSLLTDPALGQGEDLLRSLMGIVLALGFLWWGSVKQQRSWRIGSLVLMLLAVLKVFVVDAAGLAGLLRAASFIALGVSLIGIGWVYTRQLSARGQQS